MIQHNQLSSNLIRVRTHKRLTQRESAAKCHINYTTYCKIEQGYYDTTLQLIITLSRGLEVNFFELMGIDVNMIPSYFCYEDQIVTEDKEVVRTYGIAVCSKASAMSCGIFVFHYSNLTTQVDELISLVNLMNQGELQLTHVEDVIEDYITLIG